MTSIPSSGLNLSNFRNGTSVSAAYEAPHMVGLGSGHGLSLPSTQLIAPSSGPLPRPLVTSMQGSGLASGPGSASVSPTNQAPLSASGNPGGISNAFPPIQAGRLMELLDSVKAEVDSIVQEINTRKTFQDELDYKLHSHLNEMQTAQKFVQDLERSHEKMRSAYEDELTKAGISFKAISPSSSESHVSPAPTDPFIAQLAQKLVPNIGSSILARLGSDAPLKPSLGIKETLKMPPMKPLGPAEPAALSLPLPIQAPRPTLQPDGVDAKSQDLALEYPAGILAASQGAPSAFEVELHRVVESESVVCALAFSRDMKYLATGSNRVLRVYDVASGDLLAALLDPSLDPATDLFLRSVAFSPDGHYLACGAEDRIIRIWDLQTKHIVRTCEGHRQDIYSIVFSPDGKMLASGSGDSLVKLWNPHDGMFLRDLCVADQDKSRDAGVTSVGFSPDGRWLLAGSLDRAIRVWEVPSGRLLLTHHDAHADSVYSVAIHRNGRYMLSGGLDHLVHLWRLESSPDSAAVTLARIATLEGHRDFVLATGFLGNSGFAVSGSKDRQILVWRVLSSDTPEAEPFAPFLYCSFQAHKNSIISLAVPPSNTRSNDLYFATGSGDKKAKLWKYAISPDADASLSHTHSLPAKRIRTQP